MHAALRMTLGFYPNTVRSSLGKALSTERNGKGSLCNIHVTPIKTSSCLVEAKVQKHTGLSLKNLIVSSLVCSIYIIWNIAFTLMITLM